MKSKKIAEINGKNIIEIKKSVKKKDLNIEITEYVVSLTYNPNAPEGSKWSLGHYFTSLYDAVCYAANKNILYQLSVTLEDKDTSELDISNYIFDNYDDAIAKAKELLKENKVPNTDKIIDKLYLDQQVEYGCCGMISISEYYLGERLAG